MERPALQPCLDKGAIPGALVAAFGACLLLGSLIAPLVRRLLPVRAVLLLELWTWLGCALFLIWPNVYALTASILPTALAIAVAHCGIQRIRSAWWLPYAFTRRCGICFC
jgi:hypothetical protein